MGGVPGYDDDAGWWAVRSSWLLKASAYRGPGHSNYRTVGSTARRRVGSTARYGQRVPSRATEDEAARKMPNQFASPPHPKFLLEAKEAQPQPMRPDGGPDDIRVSWCPPFHGAAVLAIS